MNIPKGFKLVPEVATMRMKNAGWRERERQGIEPEDIDMQTIWVEMLLEAPTPPQPIYDEAKERELFEAEFPVPEGLVFDQDRSQYYGKPTYWLQQAQWEAWQKCAQSRAKAGEVGHE